MNAKTLFLCLVIASVATLAGCSGRSSSKQLGAEQERSVEQQQVLRERMLRVQGAS